MIELGLATSFHPCSIFCYLVTKRLCRLRPPGRSRFEKKKKKMQQRQRRYHRRSRNGCRQCKARHVRCDSVKPACENCRRMGTECVYTDSPARAARGCSLPGMASHGAEAGTAVSRRGESAHLPPQLRLESWAASMATPTPMSRRRRKQETGPGWVASENGWLADLPPGNDEIWPGSFIETIMAHKDMSNWSHLGLLHEVLPPARAASAALSPQGREGGPVCQWGDDAGARDSRHHPVYNHPHDPDFELGMRGGGTADDMEETAGVVVVDNTGINGMQEDHLPLPMPDSSSEVLPMMLFQHTILAQQVAPLPDAQE
ncbi:hypothetical protein MAPG_06393 [Magnaporthiopsis poae ATCC 64411]|uniref:Zn(2)-C6 fungal-type domain-containing protein n=1 Tax=Magnaporthiopsis poae (strain ATCC 64411 / 73-15) TaxID=644358 RepID=A0A0C4E1W9_MAGP6|nr:hypothetical protein MAPG_06393 [Magnaporthiopsis poae ATCC 64411]